MQGSPQSKPDARPRTDTLEDTITLPSTAAPEPLISIPAEKEVSHRPVIAEKEWNSAGAAQSLLLGGDTNKEAYGNTTYYPNGHPEVEQSTEREKRKKSICGVSRLVLGMILLILILIGLALGLGVGLGLKKSSRPRSQPLSPQAQTTILPSSASSSASSLASSAPSTVRRLTCPSGTAVTRRNSLSPLGFAFSTLPEGESSLSGNLSIANMYYHSGYTANRTHASNTEFRVHRLWGNGSWTDNKVPLQVPIQADSPINAVSMLDNNAVIWNIFYLDASNTIQHFSYQDPDFQSRTTRHLNGSSATAMYGFKLHRSTVCRVYYSSNNRSPTYDQQDLDAQGLMLWYPTTLTGEIMQWLFWTETTNNDSYNWVSQQTSVSSRIPQGLGCYSSKDSAVAYSVSVSMTNASYQFYAVNLDKLAPGPQQCFNSAPQAQDDVFLRNDGNLFYTQDANAEIKVSTIINAWDCSSSKLRSNTSQLGHQPGTFGTILDAATIYNGTDRSVPVAFFGAGQNDILGFEQDEEGNWLQGDNIFQC
ncbi:hypothetical protein K470DRAFT_264847 [Piedraia hortae CBS 480.64]|uniref:Fucose-specific lectin n=1 Tax=Piedraia hortae CBS 480.64 TaxID=1314780 RepID=A0A6A7BY44_9PEZI|nr:hypothetical protein K470DRAFT_264847 [Piedraia hortae CBS 480.64]